MAFVMSEYEVNNTKFANASKSICFIQISLLFTLIPLPNDLFNRKTGTKARLYFVKLPLSNGQCSGNYCLIKYSVKYTFQVTLTFRLTTANRKKPIPSVLGQHSNKQSSFFIGFLAIILCGFWGSNKSSQLMNRSILLTCHVFEKQKYPLTKP